MGHLTGCGLRGKVFFFFFKVDLKVDTMESVCFFCLFVLLFCVNISDCRISRAFRHLF